MDGVLDNNHMNVAQMVVEIQRCILSNPVQMIQLKYYLDSHSNQMSPFWKVIFKLSRQGECSVSYIIYLGNVAIFKFGRTYGMAPKLLPGYLLPSPF